MNEHVQIDDISPHLWARHTVKMDLTSGYSEQWASALNPNEIANWKIKIKIKKKTKIE